MEKSANLHELKQIAKQVAGAGIVPPRRAVSGRLEKICPVSHNMVT